MQHRARAAKYTAPHMIACSAVQYNAVQYSAVQCSAVQYVEPYMFSKIPSAIIFIQIDFNERISEYSVYLFHH